MTEVIRGVHVDAKRKRVIVDPECPVWPTAKNGQFIGEKPDVRLGRGRPPLVPTERRR